jgi:colanic acid/amylovoran biosynthesis glycosyltransferase
MTIRNVLVRIAHELLLARLRAEAWLAALAGSRSPRVAATACWTFPIHSQTFVQHEVLALARAGFTVRFLYAQLGPRDGLSHACGDLWTLKRRVLLHASTGASDLASFRRRMPAKVEALTRLVAQAARMPPENLERHDHFLQAFSFARAVEAWGADYLHSYFFYEQSLFALVASQLLGLPRGVSCYADHLLQDYALKVVPLHLATCDVIVATSRRIRGELETLQGGPLRTVVVKPNTIDTASFAVDEPRVRTDGEPLRLLCVSRIDPKKGIEYLIDAVRILVDRGLAVEARIVGPPESAEYDGALRAQVERLRLGGAVRFEGRRNSREIREFLTHAHVFVAPSVELPSGDKDGIPTAVLEAMAAGSAVVATDAGSIGEVIDDRREGLVVPQRDASALAAAVELLARDPALARRLGAAAAARARRDYDVATSEALFHDRVRGAIEKGTGVPAQTPAPR